MTTMNLEKAHVSRFLGAEIRAVLGRQNVTALALAERLGRNSRWTSVRIGANANVDITLDEAMEMAEALGVDAEGLILAALRACRDSNPKPSDP